MHSWLSARLRFVVLAITSVSPGATGCEAARSLIERQSGGPDSSSHQTTDETRSDHGSGPKVIEPDARDPAGAVALLAALCDHAKQGDHAWVAARVKLPLQGIHSINAVDEDPLVHPNDNASVENFQYTRYCLMLPDPGTALREYTKSDTTVSGIVDFGEVPHWIELDVSQDPPRLTTLDARIPPRPIPPEPAEPVREYVLGAPPRGFTNDEPPGSAKLRRRVLAALRDDPRCIEDYVTRDTSAVRFEVIVQERSGEAPAVRVEPFQLVRASLLSCLRTQLPALPQLSEVAPTSAIIELLIPVSADEVPPGTPTVEMASSK